MKAKQHHYTLSQSELGSSKNQFGPQIHGNIESMLASKKPATKWGNLK